MSASDLNQSSGRALFIEVALAGLVVFGLSLALGLVTGADTGSVPDWIAAISTFAAFMAAVFAALYAAGAYRIQRDNETERRVAEHRAQAALVSVWADTHLGYASQGGRLKVVEARVALSMRNASELPVHRVTARLFARPAESSKFWAYDDTEGVVAFHDHRLNHLPPSREPIEVQIVSAALAEMVDEHEVVPGSPVVVIAVALEFTDAAGTTWARRTDGVLIQSPRTTDGPC